MGLQNQLNDVGSDSIPLLLIALIANFLSSLRSFLLGLFQYLGLFRFDSERIDDGLLTAVGSGLASLIVLTEQLALNRDSSYRYAVLGGGDPGGSVCVVCLSNFRDGDSVRKLPCRHNFHKRCFDGWLDHLHFNCPLCRSPLVSDEHVALTERRVGGQVVSWFSLW